MEWGALVTVIPAAAVERYDGFVETRRGADPHSADRSTAVAQWPDALETARRYAVMVGTRCRATGVSRC